MLFKCDCCKYSTEDKSNFNKHVLSKKHKLLENKMVKLAISPESNLFKCKCEEYKDNKHISSLSTHSCKIEKLTELVRLLSLQVEQQQNQINEQKNQIDFIKSEIF